jgi:putative NADH-flavin reductase
MKILVLGGTGATGTLAVQQLLEQNHSVVALVRNASALNRHERLDIIEQTALTISHKELSAILTGCDAVICCLGHNLTWKGMFGAPQMLVKRSIQRICESMTAARKSPMRLVLMNTTGNRNLDRSEPVSFAQHSVLFLLRMLLPPHLDNERAANYLRTTQKNNPLIEWVAVRPDGLIDEQSVTPYTLHLSPTRSAIFNAGKTSRINMAHFMSQLPLDDELWQQWKGEMPVMYNEALLNEEAAS